MALLVLLTIAGTRAVGPAVGWHLPSRPVVITVGCALEAVLASLLVALRWRRSTRDTAIGTQSDPADTGSAGGTGMTGTGMTGIGMIGISNSRARSTIERSWDQ